MVEVMGGGVHYVMLLSNATPRDVRVCVDAVCEAHEGSSCGDTHEGGGGFPQYSVGETTVCFSQPFSNRRTDLTDTLGLMACFLYAPRCTINANEFLC